jgi:hypothetical protein
VEKFTYFLTIFPNQHVRFFSMNEFFVVVN